MLWHLLFLPHGDSHSPFKTQFREQFSEGLYDSPSPLNPPADVTTSHQLGFPLCCCICCSSNCFRVCFTPTPLGTFEKLIVYLTSEISEAAISEHFNILRMFRIEVISFNDSPLREIFLSSSYRQKWSSENCYQLKKLDSNLGLSDLQAYACNY